QSASSAPILELVPQSFNDDRWPFSKERFGAPIPLDRLAHSIEILLGLRDRLSSAQGEIRALRNLRRTRPSRLPTSAAALPRHPSNSGMDRRGSRTPACHLRR